MNELMTALYQRINEAHEYSTYKNMASQTATYPYVIYKLLPISPTESGRDDYTLEVSCWDKLEGTSFVEVEAIASKVRDALLDYRYIDDHNLIITSRPNVGYIPDPDDAIKRYDVTATLMTYRR
ncbi:DUF3168 domain-containing protein [Virgibacillus sp. CBA3643]|uniref:tail completion protein gp17 n=1 Tax=Virgibacillus sp. CBA3643 TaxID=2942278 RepID=UPI0035A3AF79